MDPWLHDADVVDLHHRRGNGPFGTFLGVVLHVNVNVDGTSDSFFAAGPPTNKDLVTPNSMHVARPRASRTRETSSG